MEQLVTLEEFKQLVELWEYKGHKNVVEVRFNSNTLNLYCPDYVEPDKVFFLNVIDTSLLVTL